MQPGTYKLEISVAGFKRLVKTDVVLPPSEHLSLGTMALELGQVTDSVAVTAQGAAVQTASS